MFLKKGLAWGWGCVFAAIVLAFGSYDALAQEERIVVIVNAANGITGISASELKLIYQIKRKRWIEGDDIELWLPPSKSREMDFLLSEIFKISSEADLRKYYLTAIFQQRITAIPSSVGDAQDAVRKVSRNKGGVALAKESEVLEAAGIKIVAIEGL